MFTGIVEASGAVVSLSKKKSNLSITIEAAFTEALIIGQSIAHNGVCLTVESIDKKKKRYTVTAVKETLLKTNLGNLKLKHAVNLERCLKASDRIDGHFVQGHVDTTAKVKSITKDAGSHRFEFSLKEEAMNTYSDLIVNKGSICINGVSLTVVDSFLKKDEFIFSVAIIPHTYTNTNFSSFKIGDKVNIEFDVLGKYIQRIISNRLLK